MKRQKKAPLQKPMTMAELRVLLQQTQARLEKCLEYNAQWNEVGAKVEALAAENTRLRLERDYWKRVAMGQQVQ